MPHFNDKSAVFLLKIINKVIGKRFYKQLFYAKIMRYFNYTYLIKQQDKSNENNGRHQTRLP